MECTSDGCSAPCQQEFGKGLLYHWRGHLPLDGGMCGVTVSAVLICDIAHCSYLRQSELGTKDCETLVSGMLLRSTFSEFQFVNMLNNPLTHQVVSY